MINFLLNLITSKLIIDDYSLHYGRVDKIYTEFDSLGLNKILPLLGQVKPAAATE